MGGNVGSGTIDVIFGVEADGVKRGKFGRGRDVSLQCMNVRRRRALERMRTVRLSSNRCRRHFRASG